MRDLLLGRKPKDFDVATSAEPRAIKRLFRNGRIIGRRFKLVHVVYGPHVIETSTFRTDPSSGDEDDDDLLIREDNEFGSAREDAPCAATSRSTASSSTRTRSTCTTGSRALHDLERGMLRTIGDPTVRIAEDPVRILRAIKFATRLGFRIEDATWEAMCSLAGELTRCAPPRVLEEILRLMRSGTALGAFRMMRASGALRALLPSVDAFLGTRDDPDPGAHDRADSYWRLLEALDADMHAGAEASNAVLLAVLFLRLLEHRVQELDSSTVDWHEVASSEIDPVARSARLPRRAVEGAKRILAAQRRFTQSSSRNFRPLQFMRSRYFPDALHLFRLRSAAWGQGWDLYEAWVQRYQRAREAGPEELAAERPPRRRRSRRRRGRRGRKRPPDSPPPS